MRKPGFKHTKEAKKNMSLSHIGKKVSEKTKEKISLYRTGKFKDGVSRYYSVHQWVVRQRGVPNKCETCGVENLKMKDGRRAIQWANISGDYLRDESDWVALCIPCHRELDDM